jgi:hypothetical protein
MTSQSATTIDHDKIRRWVDARNGTPRRAGDGGGGRSGYPAHPLQRRSADDLEAIGLNEFFDKFEEAGLAFLYQDKTAGGGTSRFHKFVERD